MKVLPSVVARNLAVYFRDRSSVFLSLLSALILLLLYLFFLGGLQVDNIQASLPQADPERIETFVDSWVLAGIVTITTFTTGFAALGSFVDDRVSGRFKEFRVSPIRPWQLILGYQGAAFLIAVAMSAAVLAVGLAYLALVRGHIPTAEGIVRAAGLIVLLSSAFAALGSFLITFVASAGAYTAVSTILGTVLGFLAGAYLPVGVLSEEVASVINTLPFSPAAMLVRWPLAGDALRALTDVEEARDAVGGYYGFRLDVGDVGVQPGTAVLGLVVVAVAFTALGAWRIGRVVR